VITRLLLGLTGAAALVLAAEPGKAGMDTARLGGIPQRMKSFVDDGTVSGTVTLVQRNGVVAALDAVGFQDTEAKTPMRPDAIFQVMSMTKPFTGVAIMMLAEEGELRLNDPVERILPEFRGMWEIDTQNAQSRTLRKPSRPITIRDLMTHTSGMPEMPPAGAGDYAQVSHMSLADAVLLYSQQPLLFEPGSNWQYSNTGLATLGRIIEVVGDMPYEKFLATRIFEPLAMKDSFFFPAAATDAQRSRIAMVYLTRDGKRSPMGDAIYRKGARYPMPEGGLYSTASDLANFYQMMLNEGSFNGKRLLSKSSVDLMRVKQTGSFKSWGDTAIGFGLTWMVANEPAALLSLQSKDLFGHGGAFGTYGWVDPQRKLVGVFLVQEFGRDVSPVRGAFVEMANAAVTE
jgi:CubicO group peptidase (beta-lactamase class C family)